MKRQLFAMALLGALAGFSSCSEEEELTSLAPTQNGIQINAEIVPYDQPAHGRTSIANDGKVNWAEGDQLYIGHNILDNGKAGVSLFDYQNGRFVFNPSSFKAFNISREDPHYFMASTSMFVDIDTACRMQADMKDSLFISMETMAPIQIGNQIQDHDLTTDKGLGRYDLMTGFTSLMGGPNVKSVNLEMHHLLSLLSFSIVNQTGESFSVKALTLKTPEGTAVGGDVYPTYVADEAGNVALDVEKTYHRAGSKHDDNFSVKVFHAPEIANGEAYEVRALVIPFTLKDKDPITIEVVTSTGMSTQTFNVKGNLEFKAGALSTATVKVDQQELFDKDNVYIGDTGLRNYLLKDKNINKNQDQKLSQQELDDVQGLSLIYENIQTLEGIEKLTNLSELVVSGKATEKIDLTQNAQLTSVRLSGTTNLKELKVNGLSALQTLSVTANKDSYPIPLSGLDLTGCTGLQTLTLTNLDYLTSVDLSGRDQLNSVTVNFSNNLESINLQGCTALTNLTINTNKKLGPLDLTGLSKLKTLDVSHNNEMTVLTLTGCTELNDLQMYRCSKMQQIDLSECTKLQVLYAVESDLHQLNVKGNKALTNLSVATNKNLQELDVSGLDKLKKLGIENCGMASLKLSGCSMLSTIAANNNNLTELDISECHHDLGKNFTNKLWIGGNPNFKTLYVWKGFEIRDGCDFSGDINRIEKEQTTTPDTPAQ